MQKTKTLYARCSEAFSAATNTKELKESAKSYADELAALKKSDNIDDLSNYIVICNAYTFYHQCLKRPVGASIYTHDVLKALRERFKPVIDRIDAIKLQTP